MLFHPVLARSNVLEGFIIEDARARIQALEREARERQTARQGAKRFGGGEGGVWKTATAGYHQRHPEAAAEGLGGRKGKDDQMAEAQTWA